MRNIARRAFVLCLHGFSSLGAKEPDSSAQHASHVPYQVFRALRRMDSLYFLGSHEISERIPSGHEMLAERAQVVGVAEFRPERDGVEIAPSHGFVSNFADAGAHDHLPPHAQHC